MPKIEIYDSKCKGFRVFDRYTAILHGHIFTMSNNPGSPQGACVYHGKQINIEYIKENNSKIDFEDLPGPVQQKINQLLAEA